MTTPATLQEYLSVTNATDMLALLDRLAKLERVAEAAENYHSAWPATNKHKDYWIELRIALAALKGTP